MSIVTGFKVTVNRCIMATDDSLWLPSENKQCDRHAPYLVSGELGQYLLGGHVCKEHLRYLLVHGREWVEAFKAQGIKKGQDILGLQNLYRKQSVWSELS